MFTILIATNNKGKIREIRDILSAPNLTLLPPFDIGLTLNVVEDGLTYADNAVKKAIAFARASGFLSLADDSGLEVDALGSKPGLYSNRFGPQPSTDASRRHFLLEQLQGKPRPWTARFRATVAVATTGGEVQLVAGECEGEIIPEERGRSGFGYDPIFLLPGLGKTMAELGMKEKNRLSHRAQALMNARPILEKYWEV
jgi:XTP/dITP diphosphohydrolase